MTIFPASLAEVHLVCIPDDRKGLKDLSPSVFLGKGNGFELLTGSE
jgi:hypothetical protein